MVGLKTKSPPCFLPKSHHFEELRCSLSDLALYWVITATLPICELLILLSAKEGKLKAVVSITIDDEFVIHDIKVIDGDKGLFIAMPSKKTGDGDYRDIAHPINSDTRGMLQRKILEAYNNASDEEV